MRSEPSKPGKRSAPRATTKPPVKAVKGGKGKPGSKPEPVSVKKPEPTAEYIIETVPGLEQLMSAEVRERFPSPPKKERDEPGVLRLAFSGKAERHEAAKQGSGKPGTAARKGLEHRVNLLGVGG